MHVVHLSLADFRRAVLDGDQPTDVVYMQPRSTAAPSDPFEEMTFSITLTAEVRGRVHLANITIERGSLFGPPGFGKPAREAMAGRCEAAAAVVRQWLTDYHPGLLVEPGILLELGRGAFGELRNIHTSQDLFRIMPDRHEPQDLTLRRFRALYPHTQAPGDESAAELVLA